MQTPCESTGAHLNEPTTRRGGVSWPLVIVVASLGLLSVLITSLLFVSPVTRPAAEGVPAGPPVSPPLVVYCAASNRAVMEAVRQDYQAEIGVEVQVQYGASQALLAAVEVSRSGDLYLPADDSFLTKARERKLVAKEFPLADMDAVVAVTKGNPHGIATLDDLLTKDVRIAQGNPEATGIGVVTQRVLSGSNQWDGLKAKTTVFKTTVNDVANDVKLNAVDAGIVYDVVLRSYPTLEGIALPELKDATSRVAVATLTTSRQPQAAERFARYLAARDKGLVRYAEFGFHPVDGAVWTDQQARGND